MGTPANLIMTGCELDSLTDGPGARLKGASASSEGRKRGEEGGQREREARSGEEAEGTSVSSSW